MQEVRILLNEDETRLPTSQFLESGILSLVMSFINYDFRSFERLRDEALRLLSSLLFCDSKPVIDCVIEEGFLNRVKMILLDSQVTGFQFGLIVNAVGNIVGTDQEYVGLIISSGIFDLLLAEARKVGEDKETKAQLIWLICNMLRCRKHLSPSKATDLLSLLLDFYEQLTDRELAVFQEVVWAILLYMSCVEDNGLAVSFLSSRNVTPGLFKAFEELECLDLIRALQEIVYRVSTTRKKENGLFTARTVEVAVSLEENIRAAREQRHFGGPQVLQAGQQPAREPLHLRPGGVLRRRALLSRADEPADDSQRRTAGRNLGPARTGAHQVQPGQSYGADRPEPRRRLASQR